MKKKKRRIGTLTLAIRYIVDLEDHDMIEQAKSCFYEDITQLAVRSEYCEFEAALVLKHDPKLKEGDIDQFLQDDAEERAEQEKEKVPA